MRTDVPLKTLTRLCTADVLSLLGVSDAEVLGVDSLERLMGKEQLMASDLISYLTDELVAERTAAMQRQLEEERVAMQRQLEQVVVETIEDVIAARFPQTPAAVMLALRDIHDPEQLRQILRAVQHPPIRPPWRRPCSPLAPTPSCTPAPRPEQRGPRHDGVTSVPHTPLVNLYPALNNVGHGTT